MGHLPKLARFSSKLVLQILPSVSATVIGGYLLAQIHIGRPADPPPPQIVIAPAATSTSPPEVPTAREERAAMRKVLRQRRENPETPEVVRPAATAQPAAPSASVASPTSTDSIAPNEPVERAAAPSRPRSAAVAPPRRDTDRADAATDYVPAPPPGLPPASGTGMNVPSPMAPPPIAPTASTQPIPSAQVVPAQPIAPAQIAPVQPIAPAPVAPAQQATGPAAPLAEPPPLRRGPVDAVFSTLSSVIGHAANATGNTVNWVIDLPGKAISAGGRVINGPSSPPPPARLDDGEG